MVQCCAACGYASLITATRPVTVFGSAGEDTRRAKMFCICARIGVLLITRTRARKTAGQHVLWPLPRSMAMETGRCRPTGKWERGEKYRQ